MVVAKALHHSQNKSQLLDFNPIENPISLQIGGDNPSLLSEAAKLAEEWGYDEINLNVGCPSPRVKAGNFGACLMANPDQVARCIEAMAKASSLPVTIKHRIGIDNLDSDKLTINKPDITTFSGVLRQYSIDDYISICESIKTLQEQKKIQEDAAKQAAKKSKVTA